jgi:hypothetical protein
VLLGSDLVGSGAQSATSIVAELGELGTLGLIGFLQTDGSVVAPSNVWNGGKIDLQSIGRVALTEVGRDLVRLAELDAIPASDQDDVAAALRGERG